MSRGSKEKQPLTPADIRTVLEIGEHRKALLERLRAAILAGDARREHAIARELAGLPKEDANDDARR
jgi:hypothetical protein